MENICLVCKKSADFSCTCDDSLKFCSKDYLLCHNENKRNHQPIDLETSRQEILLKNDCKIIENNPEKVSNKFKYKSTKFPKNLQEIRRLLKFNFNLIIEGHSSSVNSVVVTSDDKHIISGSSDNTIRI